MFYLSLYLLLLGVCGRSAAVSEFDVQSFLDQSLLRSFPTVYTPIQGNSHNPCNVSGNIGVCMFTWECVTAGGTPLGTCREDYLFGSCCFTPSLVSALIKVKVDAEGVLKPVSYGTHNCGIRSKLFLRRGHIYNGKDAQFAEFPWQVSLRRVALQPKTLPWCGGTLLNHEWILTAAHCFYRVWPTNIIARLGDHDFKNPSKHFPFVERSIKENIIHPEYFQSKKGINFYDIALLRMTSPVRFQPHISPICLPGAEEVLPGTEAIATGWGKTETMNSSSILQKMRAPIINNTVCEKMFLKEGYVLDLKHNLFCAGYAAGIQDACQGDSGGPLQMKGKDGRFFIFGIVSTGIGCAKPNFPGLYLKVFSFLHWILETMSK